MGVRSCSTGRWTALSGGQLQRVLLALALEPQPELLLLDEPAAGIDFKKQKSSTIYRRPERRTGVTVLLVSHDLTMVSRYAHHVLCLRDGEIHIEGPPGRSSPPRLLAQRSAPSCTCSPTHPH